MDDRDTLFTELFEISKHIRYIAIYVRDSLFIKQRSDIKNASAGESDKYEELLVNPTLIKLASQRGNIDCGGLQYFVIRYGNFFVLLIPCKNGHVNIGIEPDKDPFLIIEPVTGLLKKYDMKIEVE
jgi:hypothetical protein